jgi:aminopeptidase-like protein
LYILNYSDGSHSIIDIADKCGVAVSELLVPLNKLKNEGLLKLADML